MCTDGVCRLVRPWQGNGVSHEKWMRHISQRDQLGLAGSVQSPQQQPPEGSEEQAGELLVAVSMGAASDPSVVPCQQLTAVCTAASPPRFARQGHSHSCAKAAKPDDSLC